MTAVTKPMMDVLTAADRMRRIDCFYAPARRAPSKALRACIDAGLMVEDGWAVAVDGDGFTIQPERVHPAYRLTDAGVRLVAGARMLTPDAPKEPDAS